MKTKLTPCQACGQSIAKSATTCPHCGKSSTSLARIGLLVLLTVIVVWLLGGGGIGKSILRGNDQVDAAQERLDQLRTK